MTKRDIFVDNYRFRATPSTDSPSLFGTLIHSCYSKTQRPALGQIWIGAVGQYWIGANTFRAAGSVLAGVELMHMIRKGQFANDGADEMSFADQFYALAVLARPI